MINIQISSNKLAELGAKGYDLHIIALLQLLHNGENVPNQAIFTKAEAKSLRKGLISEGKVTKIGKELLEFLKASDEVKFEKKKIDDNEFLRWWECFPKHDSFEYKGRSFIGSRGLRTKRDDCKIKLNAILASGKYNIEDIVRATEYDIFLKKEASYKTGQNKLSYLQNSFTYLNQLSFDPFVEISKSQEKKEEIFTGTDI